METTLIRRIVRFLRRDRDRALLLFELAMWLLLSTAFLAFLASAECGPC